MAPKLSAIMTTNDDIAFGVVKAIFDSGKKVSHDISVSGFGNYLQSQYSNPPLTTVNHLMAEIGYLVGEKNNMYLKNPENILDRQEIRSTQLILRESIYSPSNLNQNFNKE